MKRTLTWIFVHAIKILKKVNYLNNTIQHPFDKHHIKIDYRLNSSINSKPSKFWKIFTCEFLREFLFNNSNNKKFTSIVINDKWVNFFIFIFYGGLTILEIYIIIIRGKFDILL